MIKVTVNSFPEFVQKIVELTKEGKEIDLHATRGLYGRYYTVAYLDESTSEDTVETSTTDVVSDDTAEFSSELLTESEEAPTITETTKRGRKTGK